MELEIIADSLATDRLAEFLGQFTSLRSQTRERERKKIDGDVDDREAETAFQGIIYSPGST